LIGTVFLIVDFTDQLTGNINSWSWDFGDGGTSTEQNFFYIYISADIFTVSLMVMGPGGSDPETKANYIMVTLFASLAEFVGIFLIGTVFLIVDFTDESTGDITGWSWDFGDGGTSSEQNFEYIYENVGVFTVSLTVTGLGSNNVESKTDYIVVNDLTFVASLLAFSPDGSTDVFITLTLIWHFSIGGIWYRLQISTFSDFSTVEADQSSITDISYQISELNENTIYFWRVNTIVDDGTSHWSEIWSFKTEIVSFVEQGSNELFEEFLLSQNYLNPFNPSTTVAYRLLRTENVKISIYNLVGRQIRELVNEYKEVGFYIIQWDGKNQVGRRVASGTYIYQM